MNIFRQLILCLAFIVLAPIAFSQSINRISYNNQEIFLNGANLAWKNFANDIGPGNTDTTRFANVMLLMHEKGGNALRWWLHTNGAMTPEFDGSGYVVGPGAGTIDDLKKLLDLAWQREIGMDLCLWSFDMLRSSNSSTVLTRNALLLNDTAYTNAYIRNCLIPMVEALKGHPAILTWEIFNEPEGMSNEFGWSDINHVAMSSIQRFVNLCTGAIHRTDTSAKVTSGAWSFYALTDNALAKTASSLSKMSTVEKTQIGTLLKQKYRSSLTPEEIMLHLEKIENTEALHQNYYRDDRLIAAGGDLDGTLDFYSVHYYSTSTPTSTSPFGYPAVSWSLNKPIVVGEFAMESGHGNPAGIATASLFDTLYHLGYAGALPWSFTDTLISSVASMHTGMQSMWDNHRGDVDIVISSGTIISFLAASPIIEKGQSTYLKWVTSEGSTVTLNGDAVLYSDSLQITPDTTTSFELIAQGAFTDTSVITVTVLHSGTIVSFTANPSVIGVNESSLLQWHVVSGSIVKLNDITVASDDTMTVYPAGDSTFVLTTAGSVLDTSSVTIQLINPLAVNRALNQPVVASSVESGAGVPTDAALAVDGSRSTRWGSTYSDAQWIYVDLGLSIDVQRVVLYWEAAYGRVYTIDVSDNAADWVTIFNTSAGDGGTDDLTALSGSGRYVRMNGLSRGTSWGYSIYEFEVYGTPTVVGIEDISAKELPKEFALFDNFPNPFNPTTTIRYTLPKSGYVNLMVFDILGRQVATLINEKQDAGVYEIPFIGTSLTSGVYFYRLSATGFVQTRKMLLLK